MNTAYVEFYHIGKQHPFYVVAAAFQPNDGDLVNILKVTYKVVGRSFTVDSPSTGCTMRCNVILEKVV